MIVEQRLVSVLRVFENGQAYGEPFDYSFTLLFHSPTEIEIVAVLTAPTLNQTRELINWCRENGIKKLIRNKSGRKVTHILDKQSKE